MTRLVGLPPLVADNTRLLILGSFPGAASLAAQQYYGHPQNNFWRILAAIYGASAEDICASSYENRSAWMLSKGVGLWDVYASCERVGSLDAKIRNAEVNDFLGLRQRCPMLQAVAHNGAESYRHTARLENLGLPTVRLPSTSPANASWSFERKLTEWQKCFVDVGVAHAVF
jgi:hypoxanthine-DNA glycosylase